MLESQANEIIEWATKKLDSYDKEKKLYNISAIILSVLDVVCGIVACFYMSVQVTSVVTSIICGTIWSGRCIQLIKAERLAKALKVVSTASIAYIAARRKRSEYMKKFLQNLKNNPLTIIFALVGGGLMAFATYAVAQLYFISLPQWSYILFAILFAILTILAIFLLGWDNIKPAILRGAKKSLKEEDYNKVVDMVGNLEKIAEETKLKQQEEDNKQKELDRAKAILAEYEAQVQVYENAKRVVAESQIVDDKVEKIEEIETKNGVILN